MSERSDGERGRETMQLLIKELGKHVSTYVPTVLLQMPHTLSFSHRLFLLFSHGIWGLYSLPGSTEQVNKEKEFNSRVCLVPKGTTLHIINPMFCRQQ